MAEKTAKERTGRRAWRQWSNRREYKRRRQARKHQVEYTPLMGWNKQRKANNEGIRPPEKLAKPLTASSLPGMTMGARRRAARRFETRASPSAGARPAFVCRHNR